MPGSEVEDTDPAKLTVPLLVIMLIILALFYYPQTVGDDAGQ